MQKLVFVYNYGTCEGDCGTCVIPFEFSSKDDFVLEQLNKIEKKKKTEKQQPKFLRETCLLVLGASLPFDFIESNFESYIYTLDEWFERYKEN